MGIAIEKLLRRTAVIAVAAGMFCTPVHLVFAGRDVSEFELSDSVEIEDLPNEAAAHLVRIRALLANEKWDEAVETLRKMAADPYGDYLVEVSPQRFLSVREFCQIQLAGLPPAALELYRRRVDPVADTWYEQGVAARDAEKLRRVVDRFFCSRAGDDALLWLGDWALQQGRYDEARRYWEQISPDLRAGSRLSFWYVMFGTDAEKSYRQIASRFEQAGDPHPEDWLVYPDTAIDLAAVRARLVLVSIMQDAVERARWELGVFQRLHPEDEGRLAGRDGRYRDILADLLEQQASWSNRAARDDWPTFAGASTRSRALPLPFDIPPRAKWTINYADVMPRVDTLVENPRVPARYGHREKRLGFHPLVVGDLVLFNSSEQVFAVAADTGEPAFQGSQGGQIYPRGKLTASKLGKVLKRSPLSEPRYTMTAFNDRLFVRIGTQVTARPRASGSGLAGNRLVCLDLKKEGALKWEYPSGEADEREFDKQRWAFEGPPLTDGDGVYIAMRRSESRAQSHVACFDFRTGQLRWRRKICSAGTPTRGQMNEMTHNLLTLAEDVVYLNTNLGAVAALATSDGHVRWVHQYPRADGDLSEPPPHFYRDLNPCIYYQGLIIVAPNDSRFIFALDAATGRVVWRIMPWDVMHLLGVSKGTLIATGKSIWWLRAADGRALYIWPRQENRNSPRGFGRGLLAGGNIYWPTREKIYVFDQRVVVDGQRRDVSQKPSIELLRPDVEPEQRMSGGNLVVGGGTLLVAGETRLQAFPLKRPE